MKTPVTAIHTADDLAKPGNLHQTQALHSAVDDLEKQGNKGRGSQAQTLHSSLGDLAQPGNERNPNEKTPAPVTSAPRHSGRPG